MSVFVALLLTVLAFVFITVPFSRFKRRLRPVESTQNEKLQELHSHRDTTYSMLKELEFDYQSGLLTDEDYRDLETRYRRKAISVLKNIDASEKGADLKGTDLEEEIEKEIRELRQSKGHTCPKCGATFREGDRFCAQCGTNLISGETVD